MATKFSDFNAGGAPVLGDTLVGLRAGINTQFVLPSAIAANPVTGFFPTAGTLNHLARWQGHLVLEDSNVALSDAGDLTGINSAVVGSLSLSASTLSTSASTLVIHATGGDLSLSSNSGLIRLSNAVTIDGTSNMVGMLTGVIGELYFSDTSILSTTAAADLFLLTNGGTVQINSDVHIDNEKSLKFFEDNNDFYVSFQAPHALAANISYTLPLAYPTVSGYVLSCSTAGVLSWIPN